MAEQENKQLRSPGTPGKRVQSHSASRANQVSAIIEQLSKTFFKAYYRIHDTLQSTIQYNQY